MSQRVVPREVAKATAWGLLTVALLAALVALGSRNLAHFDAALVAYTFAVLFATFGIAYRYAMWLQRPPTAVLWRRGWQVFLRPGLVAHNLRVLARLFVRKLALNDFIFRRSALRGAAHWSIMWGCIVAGAITFPLVFGWLHFTTQGDDFDRYVIHVFGFEVASFRLGSAVAFLIFHGLVWSSILVIAGVMLAMRRRMTDRGAEVAQHFDEDVLPLLMLFAISVTGLLLTASYTWMRGYAYDFLAILHAVTVILTLLWLPFGKLFHVFQRPAQLGAAFYRSVGLADEQVRCARCSEAFAPRMQVEDLERVERELGYSYELPGHSAGHYQRICPRCRRVMLALAQGRLFSDARGPAPPEPRGLDVAAWVEGALGPALDHGAPGGAPGAGGSRSGRP